jgi:hypothetical protein
MLVELGASLREPWMIASQPVALLAQAAIRTGFLCAVRLPFLDPVIAVSGESLRQERLRKVLGAEFT